MQIDVIREAMEKFGIPGRDLYDLPSSEKRFPDGAQYRNEISGVERPSTLEALIDESDKLDIPIHRVISTIMGATLLTERELEELSQMAHDAKLELVATPGPRASWDVGRHVATPEGALSGLRLRGCDSLSYAIGDIMRCVEQGIRGFLVIDEGLLWLLSKMREDGLIPKETVFKVSIYAGHANPAGGKLLQDLGANTFNPVGDLSLPMLASIRKTVDIPIDVHIYLSESFGGFNRFWEGSELARVASPCYFKIEPGTALAVSNGIYKPWTLEDFLANFAREKVKYAAIIRELIGETDPDVRLSGRGPDDLAIPR
jgi:hypothetical protein